MKLVDKVWLACAIDSEGSIGFYRRGFNQDGIAIRAVRCELVNTNRDYMEKAAHLMQARLRRRKMAGQRKDGQPYRLVYFVEVKHVKAYRLLKLLEPLLIVKREKAKELLGLYENGVIKSRAFHKDDPQQLRFPEENRQVNLPVGSAHFEPWERD